MNVDYEKIEKAWFTPKEKTAREMFEELGFTLIKYNERFLQYENSDDEIICFDRIEKYYWAYCRNNEHDFDIYTDDAIIINMKLHKAINKQVEELWEGNNENNRFIK